MTSDRPTTELEQRLRATLGDHAADATGTGADLDDVFGRARRIRQRRAALVAGLAAVAIVAVAVPAGVLLGSHDASAPAPIGSESVVPTTTTASTAPASSSPATSSATSQPAGAGLGGLPIGKQTTLTYLDPTGTMHNDQALPGGDKGSDPVTAFTPYHGGWIVFYDLTMKQYDSSGAVVATGDQAANLVVSDDGTQTAWQTGRTVHTGIASGMGEGEQTIHLAADEGLVGFLGDGVAVSDGTGLRVLTGTDTSTTIATTVTPTVVSRSANLIGGVMGTPAQGDQEGAMADGTTGTVLWHNSWRPAAISQDGKYVAAVPVVDNGEPSAVAILDARTGAVVAQTPDLSGKFHLGLSLAWDDDRVVFAVAPADGQEKQALAALDTSGRLEQVSPTLATPTMDGFSGAGGYVFMTR
jgi:hypothetical protein